MLLWWFIGIAAMTLLTLAFFHSLSSSNLDQSFKTLPPAVQKIAGTQFSFKTVDGYIRQQIFALRIPMLTIILAVSLLIGLSAGDESRGLLEQQLSLPISRTGLLLQKLAAALVIVTVATCGAMAGILIALLFLHEHESFRLILEYTLSCAALSFTYGMVGFLVAALTGRHGLAVGIASAFAFLSYLINSLAPAVSLMKNIDKLTFFHLYQLNPFSWGHFLGLIIAIAALSAVSIMAFNRRDIRQN